MAWILHCCGCGYRPAATAPIQPLAWELPYAMSKALKKKMEWSISSLPNFGQIGRFHAVVVQCLHFEYFFLSMTSTIHFGL